MMNNEKLKLYSIELLNGHLPNCLPDELTNIIQYISSLIGASNSPSIEQIRKILKALNNERLFKATSELAQSWRLKCGLDLVIEKHYIMALIELGNLDEAEKNLAKIIPYANRLNNQQAKIELGEYQGQQARIAKQRFILFDDIDSLDKAIKLYATRYRSNGRPYYHGINVVALVAAQERLEANLEISEDIKLPTLAEQILKDILDKVARGDDSPWLFSSASEAYLALNQCDLAELWLYRFLQHPLTYPFHIESYSRQLREIWQGNALRNLNCADKLSRIIDQYVMRTQKRWSISSEMLKTAHRDPQSYEKNFSGERTFTVNMIRQMLEKCASIGCVTNGIGQRLGTGFLVSANTFGLGAADELVFVTNSHVISDNIKDAITPSEAWVTFELECVVKGHPILHKVSSQVLFTSPPGIPGITSGDKLDVTVVKLMTWPKGGLALRTNDSLPIPSPKTKVFIVGHPSGDALQLSLHDTELLDVCDEERLLHYRTPTEPGSSGSPVFNMNWEVVALHHAGSSVMPHLHGKGEYEANEGISIHSIREAISIRNSSDKIG